MNGTGERVTLKCIHTNLLANTVLPEKKKNSGTANDIAFTLAYMILTNRETQLPIYAILLSFVNM